MLSRSRSPLPGSQRRRAAGSGAENDDPCPRTPHSTDTETIDIDLDGSDSAAVHAFALTCAQELCRRHRWDRIKCIVDELSGAYQRHLSMCQRLVDRHNQRLLDGDGSEYDSAQASQSDDVDGSEWTSEDDSDDSIERLVYGKKKTSRTAASGAAASGDPIGRDTCVS